MRTQKSLWLYNALHINDKVIYDDLFRTENALHLNLMYFKCKCLLK